MTHYNIEGNENFEIPGIQACYGGLRQKWNSAVSRATATRNNE